METTQHDQVPTSPTARRKTIKCLVWDLDHTLWAGILLEDEHVTLKAHVANLVHTLDKRGILQSIASRNDPAAASARLQELGLLEYFLYPQINWNSKASSIATIAAALNIGPDTIAFLDDQPFERDEVRFSLPDVLCIDSADIETLLDRPEFNPRFITADSSARRLMYLSDMQRQKVETEFVGTKDEFLATLGMRFTIAPAGEDDLQRAEELTIRTNQLNTTGYTYSYEELDAFRQSPAHKLLIAELNDRYGSYGKIGLALVECASDQWTIKLLLMSCRVMARGVGTILIKHVVECARAANVRLFAEFLANDRNRMMYMTYKFAGFKEINKNGELTIFEHDLVNIPAQPPYVEVNVSG